MENVDGKPAPAKGPNMATVGKRYTMPEETIREEDILAYAAATDDTNPRFTDVGLEGGIVAPPIFAVKPMFSVLSGALYDEEVGADVLRLVHGEQTMRFYRPLRPGQRVVPGGEITSIEEKSSGYLINVRQYLMHDGEMAVEATSGLFVRKPRDPNAPRKAAARKGAEAGEVPERDVLYEEQQFVAPDQSVRYAAASGDHNPIHVDPEVARRAGLPNIILHGLCTMAMAVRAVVDGVLGGDPVRLEQVRVRFASPVLPESTLTTRVWRNPDGTLGFETTNQDGVVVLAAGQAQLGPEA